MTTTTQPLRLGSLELLADRLIHSTSSRAGHMVETLHLDQVHRTAVRYGHIPVYAAVSLVLAFEYVFGVDLGHLSSGLSRLWLGVAAVVCMAVYVLTRTVTLSVSAGAHTIRVRLRGGKARSTQANRFARQVDAAAMQARRSVRQPYAHGNFAGGMNAGMGVR